MAFSSTAICFMAFSISSFTLMAFSSSSFNFTTFYNLLSAFFISSVSFLVCTFHHSALLYAEFLQTVSRNSTIRHSCLRHSSYRHPVDGILYFLIRLLSTSWDSIFHQSIWRYSIFYYSTFYCSLLRYSTLKHFNLGNSNLLHFTLPSNRFMPTLVHTKNSKQIFKKMFIQVSILIIT